MVRHQHPLRCISQRFTHTPDTAAIGRDKSVAIGNAFCRRQSRDPGDTRQSASNQFAAIKKLAHETSFLVADPPVIIARMRLRNPEIAIITM